jgi:methylated-DNA-protein-cysteine methyltransferase related protein
VAARKTSRAKGAALAPSLPAPARRAARELGLTVELPETVAWWEEFYSVVRRIPEGRVCTYGTVAMIAGHPRAARHVGHALSALKESGAHRDVPWHRVLGSRSRTRAAISIKDPVGGALQRKLLEREGVPVDERGGVSLDAFGWLGGARATAKERAAPAAPARRAAKKDAARRATKKDAKRPRSSARRRPSA